jgi:uncharacterized PurR-regulated membrane protein YhhQ (DUF165 family)
MLQFFFDSGAVGSSSPSIALFSPSAFGIGGEGDVWLVDAWQISWVVDLEVF